MHSVSFFFLFKKTKQKFYSSSKYGLSESLKAHWASVNELRQLPKVQCRYSLT